MFVFSTLQFVISPKIIVWQLTILATEFGQWLAVITFIGIGSQIYLSSPSRLVRPTVFLTVIACLLFLWPSAQMLLKKDNWINEISRNFKIQGPPPPSPSFAGLWSGVAPFSRVSPQTISFKPSADLLMDFYRAPEVSNAPWLLVIHGGGWDSGDRSQLPEFNSVAARAGISVFSLDYRLAPQWKWPAAKEDILDAVKFIKGHSAEYGVDVHRFAVLGRSAGGQLAELLAYQNHDSDLKGVIGFYAPSDMNFAYKWGKEDDILESRKLLRNFMGGTPEEIPHLYIDASPLNFVNAQSPPTLLFHGPNDSLVWVRHSRRLNEKLLSLGRLSLLIELPWATHGFDFSLHGPGGQVSTFAVLYFLQHVFEK